LDGGGLAGAVGAEEGEDLTGTHTEGEIVDDGAPPVDLSESRDYDSIAARGRVRARSRAAGARFYAIACHIVFHKGHGGAARLPPPGSISSSHSGWEGNVQRVCTSGYAQNCGSRRRLSELSATP